MVENFSDVKSDSLVLEKVFLFLKENKRPSNSGLFPVQGHGGSTTAESSTNQSVFALAYAQYLFFSD